MDAPALPDDPRDWPTDPFALLGVPRSVGEADLKRAYTRLIRKYKPEHAPDQFRRIREAYEAAIEMSRWYRDAPPVRETFHDLPFTAVPPPSSEAAPPADGPRIDPPARAVDPVDAAWSEAVAGNRAEAYSALVALAARHPERADVSLRLYWLLAVRPALDEARARHDWLAAALTGSGLSGPAVELYRRELAADPQTALYAPYVRLLEVPGARGDRVLAVATARLAAAAAEERWALLDIDLAALAGRAADLDDGAWLAYLTDLAARAAGERAVAERCRVLLAGLRHLELSHGWAFDRLEHRQVLLANLSEARIPDPLRRALLEAEAGDGGPALAAAVAWAAADPSAALWACDAGPSAEYGRPILAAVEHRGGHAVGYPSGLVRELVRAHLAGAAVRDYRRDRARLLAFLLAERIDPDELVDACADDPRPAVSDLAHHVRHDPALRLVYRLASADL